MVSPIRPNESPNREPTVPAWTASVFFHAAAIVLFGLLYRAVPVGAVEEPARTAGIVLKHIEDDGDWFEGEEDRGDEVAEDSGEHADALVAALPRDDATQLAASALPNLPLLGPGALEHGGVGDAGTMTRGGGGRPGGLAGGAARVRVFGAEGIGRKFVYVFDRSVSMEGPRLAAAKQELIRSLDSLDRTHQFQILFFNHKVRTWDITGGQNRIAFGTSPNKKRAAEWVRGISADGGTDRVAALLRAIALAPDVIFFLTDDDTPMLAVDLKHLRRRNRGRAAINAIEFGSGPAHGRRNFLVQLTEQTRGQYVYINTRRLRQ